MAGLPPSPDSRGDHGASPPPLSPLSAPSPLDFASPEGFVQFVDGESDAKRARADVGSGGGIRWSCDAPRGQGGRPSSLSPGETSFEPVNFSPHPHPYHPQHLLASKASSGSLASSHPSHNSFASTQTDSSVPTSTPDSALYAAPSAVHPGAASHGTSWAQPQPVASSVPSQTTDKRLKRLERNRESARLSRKRRKAYLEELEVKVHALSAQMDRERILYANGFLRQVRERMSAYIHQENHAVENAVTVVHNPLALHQHQHQQNVSLGQGIKHNLQSLTPPSLHAEFNSGISSNNSNIHNIYNVTRLPSALQIIYTFQHQYQASLVVSKESKFVLWLMLQKEGFWRGGRGSSERLSAARIGERVSARVALKGAETLNFNVDNHFYGHYVYMDAQR